jgi:hypothetical protein
VRLPVRLALKPRATPMNSTRLWSKWESGTVGQRHDVRTVRCDPFCRTQTRNRYTEGSGWMKPPAELILI